jgi:hypothetical protein
MATKVNRLRNGAGGVFFVASEPDRKGNYKQYSAEEVSAGQFEVIESATAESILRESDGWVKVPRKNRFAEDDSQEVAGVAHSLTARGFVQSTTSGSGTWKRGDVTVLVGTNGSWKCGKSVGKNCHDLNSLLDSQYPQESTQDRLRAAFENFLPPAEAALAARGPMENGSDISSQLRGNALMNRLRFDLMEPQR